MTCPSNSPENWYKVGKNPRTWNRKLFDQNLMSTICAGPTCDSQMLRHLFDSCLRASKILDRDTDFRQELQQAKDLLPPNQIGKHGQLQEWLEDWDDPQDDHRHFTHLWGMYPGVELSVEKTPDLARAVRQSLIHRGDGGTGFGMAWQVCLWARMYEAEKALQLFKNLMQRNTFKNLFSNCFGTLQVDGTFGATAGIAEMLLQSWAGEINLLPALPTAWSAGQARGWRARGGFEVDFAWSGNALTGATVRSLRGNGCRLRHGATVISFSTSSGKSYDFDGKLRRR